MSYCHYKLKAKNKFNQKKAVRTDIDNNHHLACEENSFT